MRYKNRAFIGGSITIDNNNFIDCTFQDCKMIYHGGNFSISGRTAFQGEIELIFQDSACRTLKFLGIMQKALPGSVEAVLERLPDPSCCN